MFFDKKAVADTKSAPSHVKYKEELAFLRETVTRLSSRLDMMDAKEEAQKELRSITNQKFDKINEQIGEVRELFKVLSSEKKEMDVKISQTVEIVKQVKPEQIAKQMQNFTHQMSVLEGKVQLATKQYVAFKQDYDHFSHKLKVFKGEDELLKLQTRVKQDLDDVTKVSHQANMHASKIENHFIKINEKAAAVQNSISELKALKEALTQLQVDLTKQSEASTAADLTSKIHELEETVNSLTDLTSESFVQLKKDISSAKEQQSSVSPVEFEKVRRWVSYLVKLNQQKPAVAKK